MRNRKSISRKSSKKMFTKSASSTHRKNTQAKPMRGGIRL